MPVGREHLCQNGEKFAAAQNGASGVSSVNGETEPETVVMAEAAASDDVEE